MSIIPTRIIGWSSTFCRCEGTIEVDVEDGRVKVAPCSYDHVYYCMRVAYDVLQLRVRELSDPWKKDVKKMDELLLWKSGNFMRYDKFTYEANGLSAYKAFWDYESKGVSLPKSLEEPELLTDLLQAKRNREFTINDWLDVYYGTFLQNGEIRFKKSEYPIWPEEYLTHPAMTNELFKSLFGREPNERIKEALMTMPIH